ncbi:hypothetical protein ACEVHA_028380 [Klebsiella pneumoniae]
MTTVFRLMVAYQKEKTVLGRTLSFCFFTNAVAETLSTKAINATITRLTERW